MPLTSLLLLLLSSRQHRVLLGSLLSSRELLRRLGRRTQQVERGDNVSSFALRHSPQVLLAFLPQPTGRGNFPRTLTQGNFQRFCVQGTQLRGVFSASTSQDAPAFVRSDGASYLTVFVRRRNGSTSFTTASNNDSRQVKIREPHLALAHGLAVIIQPRTRHVMHAQVRRRISPWLPQLPDSGLSPSAEELFPPPHGPQ